MTPRVAVVGGDSRAQQVTWPRHVDVHHYPSEKYGGNVTSIRAAVSSGKFSMAIVLTKWISHSLCQAVRDSASCPVVLWDRGLGEAAKMVATTMQEPKQEEATMIDAGGSTNMNGTHTHQTFAEALRGCLERSQLSQGAFADSIDVNRSTISSWLSGEKCPRIAEYARLTLLLPEIAAIPVPRLVSGPHVFKPEEAARRVADAVRRLREQATPEPIAAPPADPGVALATEQPPAPDRDHAEITDHASAYAAAVMRLRAAREALAEIDARREPLLRAHETAMKEVKNARELLDLWEQS